MAEFPPPDWPPDDSTRLDPPAGCVGTIVGVLAALLGAFAASRVLSAAPSGTTWLVGGAAALGYVGVLVFAVRSRDEGNRRFARAVLVTVPIVLFLLAALSAPEGSKNPTGEPWWTPKKLPDHWF